MLEIYIYRLGRDILQMDLATKVRVVAVSSMIPFDVDCSVSKCIRRKSLGGCPINFLCGFLLAR